MGGGWLVRAAGWCAGGGREAVTRAMLHDHELVLDPGSPGG